MGTVMLGGRTLDVKPATMGFVRRKFLPALDELQTKEEWAPILLLYLGHNEGVTAEWLEDELMLNPLPDRQDLPPDGLTFLKQCMAAAGQKVIEPKPGEAQSPQTSPSGTPTGTSAPTST
jgi:hypothetical protein